jgi:hypothetical protein
MGTAVGSPLALTLTGGHANLLVSSGTTLAAIAGAITLSGGTADIVTSFNPLNAAPGTITIVGGSATISTPAIIITGYVADANNYNFVIADLSGNELDEVPANNPVWVDVLNDSGTASFTLPNRHPKALRSLLPVGQCELHIYRTNQLVWGGHLYTAQAQSEADVRFGFSGYFERLKRRYVDSSQNFQGVDQFSIAWNLINFTQTKANGALGMGWTRFSTAPSGVVRDMNYPFWERSIIGQNIIDLSALNNGFDFEVTALKEWKTYYPSKGAIITMPLEYGKNIDGISIMEDASDNANVYAAIGAGDGKSTCIAVAFSTTNEAAYGLLEQSDSFTSVKHFAILQDRATEGLRMKKAPRKQPALSVLLNKDPLPYTYFVGDRIMVYANEGYLNVNQQFRVISITHELSNEGRESITLDMDDQVSV